ncbi:MAG: hypothetical protein QOF02_1133 [Blastocatellia bacterium]|jgi:hypothetical protein|nr:hypothetical protein [Blastocatellia bacterium]
MSIHCGDRRNAGDSNRSLKLVKTLRSFDELLKDKEDCKSAPGLSAAPRGTRGKEREAANALDASTRRANLSSCWPIVSHNRNAVGTIILRRLFMRETIAQASVGGSTNGPRCGPA